MTQAFLCSFSVDHYTLPYDFSNDPFPCVELQSLLWAGVDEGFAWVALHWLAVGLSLYRICVRWDDLHIAYQLLVQSSLYVIP